MTPRRTLIHIQHDRELELRSVVEMVCKLCGWQVLDHLSQPGDSVELTEVVVPTTDVVGPGLYTITFHRAPGEMRMVLEKSG